MRVLIVEDNRELAESLGASLHKKYRLAVDVAHTAEDGDRKLAVNTYDVVLIDINLPDQSGLELLAALRSADNAIPAIIITARDSVEEKTDGLNQGADDYIVKPFAVAELHARIKAVTRRSYGKAQPTIAIGKLTINPAVRTVFYDDQEIALMPREFDILEQLALESPAVISAEAITEHVYDESFDPFSSVLRVHIARLRRKLADVSGQDCIRTVRGKGYALSVK